MSQCKKFAPNIFHKTKCTNCFRQKEEHSAEALECNRASRSIARSGYLFVAPDWDFSVPLNRTKRWQRRWFVLYDDGELNYSVDEHPDTIPQGSVDMSKVLEVTGAEQVTGHPHSLALTSPDRVTFVKAASREDARWWAELLAVFPRRHKRNATFPGGRASPSLPLLGRSASPQPPRPRHLSCSGPSPRANFETPPLKEERESSTPKDEHQSNSSTSRSGWLPEPTRTVPIAVASSPIIRNDYLISSGSPPTRDKLRCDDKARARRDWRNERLRDIATALTDRSPESSLTLPAESLLHLKKGWLWLKNSDGEECVRRWIVLCGHTLNIYHEQDEQKAPETVVELSTVTSYNEIVTETKYGFEIKSTASPTLRLNAVTAGIRSNWLQALNKAAPIPPILRRQLSSSDSSAAPTPTTPRSLLLSSDEEYRTASEGGRRGSEDWSELPPSPSPPSQQQFVRGGSLMRAKDRTRLRPRLPRCQSSRQSTLDSTSTDELDCVVSKVVVPESVELLHNSINKQNVEINDLQKQLAKALDDVQCLEEEIARLKKFQSDAVILEQNAKDMMLTFERTEKELNQRNSQAESKFSKEQRTLQRRLADVEDVSKTYEERCKMLSHDLHTKQRILVTLQDELTTSNERLSKTKEENDRLFKQLEEYQESNNNIHVHNNNNKINNVDSLTDLININLDVDIDELETNELKEYCLDLRGRFEKAVIEIRAVKRQLRESYEKCDILDLQIYSLQNGMEIAKQDSQSEITLLVTRLEHLTSKLSAAEKQLRIKSRNESKEKRRSLSLKGRESFSINKEVEDKVNELEAKMLTLEQRGRTKRKYKRDRSSERSSPIDDRALRRLRRKSLDSATTSEPMKLLMRLSTLESKILNVNNNNTSNESLNQSNNSLVMDLTTIRDNTETTTRSELNINNNAIFVAKVKINECLCHVNCLLKNRNKMLLSSTSLSQQSLFDRLISLERNLNELKDIFDSKKTNAVADEIDVINSSANGVVKQLQTLLVDKLTSLAEKKRQLKENNQLDDTARLQILAEKVAYENILISRIQEALLNTPSSSNDKNGEEDETTICHRLVNKEMKETVFLMNSLQNKLNGVNNQKNEKATNKPSYNCKTSADYLTQILAKCLLSATHGFMSGNKNFNINKQSDFRSSSSLNYLRNEQQKLNTLLGSYKATKLPQLAEALAAETINLSTTDKAICRLRLSLNEETIDKFTRTAREIVNSELIDSEINHVLLRAAQIYQTNIDADHTFFFSFFASERATLELWSDSVGDCLLNEINKNINELSELYQNNLSKLQRQTNWRKRVESERNLSRTTSTNNNSSTNCNLLLLNEFADIIAHKALIDARIDVLSGGSKFTINQSISMEESSTRSSSWLIDSCNNIDDHSFLVQNTMNNQSCLEAEFTCMLDRYSKDCYALIGQPELDQVLGYLNDLAEEIGELQRHANLPKTTTVNYNDVIDDDLVVRTWSDVCQKCKKLRNLLEDVRLTLQQQQTTTNHSSYLIGRSSSFKKFETIDEHHQRPVYLGTEYLTQVENLRAAYRRALTSCKERHQESDIEQLQQLCERVLVAMEQWHRRTIQEIREAHAHEMDGLKQEKEQALAEETQATLAALDAMRKAHEAEVQREVVKFKQEFARQQRNDIMDLSERLSVKCLEAAALEEQLGSATRQLTHAQQHILQLERNPQLSAMQN